MGSIIPRDVAISKLSDQELEGFISSSSPLARSKGLHELFFRRKNSDKLKALLFSSVSKEINRTENFYGFIKVAWIPVIDILDAGDESEKNELKKLLISTWSFDERKRFYEYVKKNFEVSDLLT